MEDELVTLQISAEYRERLRRLADQRKRSMKREFEWIIDEEETRRNLQITVSTETVEPSASQQ